MPLKTENLGCGIEVVVTREHTFGTDAVLLADFAAPKPRDFPIDLGTGCGVIPLIWCRRPMPEKICCFEIQENAVEQVEKSIEMNGLSARMELVKGDLREIASYYPGDRFSLVTMNPPYKPVSTGIESTSQSAKIARHETLCTVYDAVRAGAYLLRFGGRLCMCHRPERLADVMDALRSFGVEPKKLRFVVDKTGQSPFLFLIEARKGGKPFLTVLPELVIRDERGKFSEEMMKIYGEYGEGYHQ